jgi:hypothetical protein
MRVIDVHTHMLAPRWVETISKHGGRFAVGVVTGGQQAVFQDGAPFMTLTPPMTDYDLRIADMDTAGVDTAIVSLTCPSVFWGDEVMSAEMSSFMNDDMSAAQGRYPGRIHYFATLPWEYPDRAVRELKRAADLGAVGVMCLGNIAGEPLTSPRFSSIWTEIERLDLPVLVHPTSPPGADAMDMVAYNLIDLRRLPRPFPQPQTYRQSWRRNAALPGWPPRPVLVQHASLPRQHRHGAQRIPPANLVRLRAVPQRSARSLPRCWWNRPRSLRIGLSPQHRRHGRGALIG